MKTRKEISSLIEQLLSDDISPEKKDELLKLIEENKFVREEFLLRQKIEKAIKKKEIIELRHQLESVFMGLDNGGLLEEPRQIYRSNWLKVAAVIILLISLGSILYFHLDDLRINNSVNNEPQDPFLKNITDFKSNYIQNREEQNSYNEAQPKDINSSASENIKEEQVIAMNYVDSEYFDSFIDNYRSVDIDILQPLPFTEFKFGSIIIFKWESDQQDSLMLKIYNNQELQLISVRTAEKYQLDTILSPGLYYWKIESEDDLLYMNKFYIR